MTNYTGTLPAGPANPIGEGARRAVRGLLCDLDDTLFDHAHATREALARLLASDETARDWALVEVEARHNAILETLHVEVLAGRRSVETARVERFRRLLQEFGDAATPERAAQWAGAYRAAYEIGWRAVAGAIEFLTAVRSARLPIAIVTNNQRREQVMKLERCGLSPYVTTLVTSEEVGASKPAPEIFQCALDRLQLAADDVVMLGDGWATDIEGARRFGMRAIWFNRLAQPSPDPTVTEIRSLPQATAILGLAAHR